MNLHLRWDREGLVHRAAVRDLQQRLLLRRGQCCREVQLQIDAPHAMGLLGEGPASLDGETLTGDLMPRAVAGHEIADAAPQRADEELHRTHTLIMSAILDWLVGHDVMRAASDVEPDSSSKCDPHGHRASLFKNSRMAA